jgi:H+-transporting ATPase
MQGLSNSEATERLTTYGYNELPAEKKNVVLKFLSYFWGPIPWMIEVALILSIILEDWANVGVIAALLIVNALVGFFQEHQAANAVEALKKKLALKARVLRDGEWKEIPAREVVPGDTIRIRIGEIVPADCKLVEGDYLTIDQSALTGESLPVDKGVGDECYSGSIAKQGEMVAEVTTTGSKTYFGKTAELVRTAKAVSHFQKAVLRIGDYLIYLSLSLAIILLVVQLARGDSFLQLLQFILILVVAAIPVAMPAVLSVTMAVGALVLAKMKAIVTRLESIEEMAGMEVLCCDKTGTLTQNKLALTGEPSQEIIQAAALASETENPDAIDGAILAALKGPQTDFTQKSFTPFDPVAKRSSAEIQGPEGTFFVTKGAPQVIFALCNTEETEKVKEFAQQGFRTLGVARSSDGKTWQYVGLLALSDPPREDSAETIRRATQYGITVKMVTGDNTAIAEQIAGQLGLGQQIQSADDLSPDAVEKADGFAQVFPEHKFTIVKALQSRDHIVGMTGDGVNDAPALKQANTGIAVSGATDAARAAADLVLTAPGLSVIIAAVEEARRIFERMNSYAIYRITETIRILFFVFLSMIVFNFYPITSIMIILLAFFNDLPIMAISYDNTWLDTSPVRWQMRRILSVATVLGLVGVIETFIILLIGKLWLHLPTDELQTFIFLKLAVAGHFTLFVARTKHPFLKKPHPRLILLLAIVCTQAITTLISAFGVGLLTPLPWHLIGFVWAYCLVWVFIEDWAKLYVYHHLHFTGPTHRSFLSKLKRPLHPGI